MRFAFIIIILLLGGCTKSFKTNYESKDEIVIEELEPITRLDEVKAEMQERLAEIKDE
jgi:lipoprotein NlpI|tara:strand:- start:731 stop:904 length:174 start_codon:yes stop_codon:yes gene_type:complete